ncbi:hypothetical protein [Marinobacterium rhizophilum]|uniref:Tetratricopeptide repeat protein n=1 Tax=Marinobacterium rhizophilum TaxID=420402 RepID=A0ABY5HJ25_9GAMM|nr:hypothetical protein [Marinobacterium rhizophilum]UTW12372.1 hypothetical protein KDW95_01425 [Marinobacterium rhizophilum]
MVTSAWHRVGTSLPTLLADALHKAGHNEEALSVAQEALALRDRHREPVFEAELYRLEAELLVMAPGRAKACEDSFRRAIETAICQGARLLELRAALGLNRLLQRLGRNEEVARLLAPVCRAYPEDPDAADLHEAKTILARTARP